MSKRELGYLVSYGIICVVVCGRVVWLGGMKKG